MSNPSDPGDEKSPARENPADLDLPTTHSGTDPALTAKLVEVLDRYLADLQSGNAVDREALLAEHPELANQLNACLAGIDFIHGGEEGADSGGGPRLADFRILREVGRGGMGAVYEAEQISLDRRVALKVLRFGAVSDPQALSRFQREAETVANLHHTNIVPIYSVGCENGVNFYAMQFIDGRSLDFVQKDGRGVLDVKRVVAWGLQAAEALNHAHQRHVIHRDVKPSNLILDDEDRIWLTDFGLAKRLDDVTLSMTGALLGTPRYMSPEQAESSMREIDQRSDIYSLGATLYELLTGKPVFSGENYHIVIGKILHEEPPPPRQYRADIPRDVETILLKCLSKSPALRYDGAEDLAEDLRAFLHHRPIKARRANLVELSTRWLQRNRGHLSKTMATVAVTACIIGTLFFGWRNYTQSRRASLALTSAIPMVAELVDAEGRRVTVTLPTHDPIDVAAGDFTVRVSGDGLLDSRFRATASAGQQLKYAIPLETDPAADKVDVMRAYRLWPRDDGRVDVVLMDMDGIRRFDPVSGETVWSLKLDQPTSELLVDQTNFSWTPQRQGPFLEPFIAGEIVGNRGFDSESRHDAAQVADVNSDGEADIILAGRRRAWLLAVSGKDGTPVWLRILDGDSDSASDGGSSSGYPQSGVLTSPSIIGDLDADGIADLLVTSAGVDVSVAGANASGNRMTQNAKRWIEAVSGANGKTLWQIDLADKWFALPKGNDVPNNFCWFPDGNRQMASSSSLGTSRRDGMIFRSNQVNYQSHGFHLFAPDSPHALSVSGGPGSRASEIVADQPSAMVGLLAGTHLVAIDADTGKILSATETGSMAIQPAVWKDVDGDQIADAVLLDQPSGGSLRCSVWSVAKQEMLWRKDLNTRAAFHVDAAHVSASWPMAVDLDGDGKSEIILPSDSSEGGSVRNPHVPWGQIEVLNGENGQRIWARRLLATDQQIDQFAVGPDLDGDNIREIFTSTLWGDKYDLYVDALSGADGQSVWWSRQPIPSASDGSGNVVLGPLRWWRLGSDDLPRLLVPTCEQHSPGKSLYFAFSAGTGQLAHTMANLESVMPIDVEATGQQDLLAYRKLIRTSSSHPTGELHIVRNRADRWRRLAGSNWSTLPDIDGDGIGDLVARSDGATSRAFSGRGGDMLWETRGENYNPLTFAETAHTLPDGFRSTGIQRDLDSDGVPDLLAWQRTGAGTQVFRPIHAISGKSGQKIWAADISVHVMRAAPLLEMSDLDGDGKSEVVLVGAMDWGYGEPRGYGTNDQQLWLAVLNGRTGKVLWKQSLSAAYGPTTNTSLPYQFKDLMLSTPKIDLDDDGILDLVVPAESASAHSPLELRGFSGRDGTLLWQHLLPPTSNSAPFERLSRITPADLDQDGKQELLVMALQESTSGNNGRLTRIHHLQALNRDGQVRWTWQGEAAGRFNLDSDDPLDRRGPVVLRTNRADPLICLPFTTPKELVVLDPNGSPVFKRPIEDNFGCRVWAADGDGDGADELILEGTSNIRCIRLGEPESTVWQVELDTEPRRSDPRDNPRLIGLRLGGDSQPPTLLLRHGAGDNSLEGIDVASGQRRWRCQGPTPQSEYGQIRVETLHLLNAKDSLPPLVFFQSGSVAQCRQAALARPTETVRSDQSARTTFVAKALPHDPRLLRELPWNGIAGKIAETAAQFWVCGGLYCVTLIIFPVGCLMFLIRRRRWSLRTFALLPVVAAFLLLGLQFDGPEPVVFTILQKFIVGIAFVPFLAVLACVAMWALTRQFRTFRFWFIFASVVTAFIAVISLIASNVGQTAWLPGEHYSWEGWYWICLIGIYFTGWALVTSIPRTLVNLRTYWNTASTQI